MKILPIILLIVAGVILYSCKGSKKDDSVKIADVKNKQKAAEGTVDKEVADFLVKIYDARMMDTKEGELAVVKGTTSEIKDYGKLMIRDQAILMAKIKELAAQLNVTLPADISSDKKDGFETLNAKSGKDFDAKFCKMIKLDHERDVKDFTEAIKLTEKNTSAFAVANLPLIQSHLDKIKAIQDK